MTTTIKKFYKRGNVVTDLSQDYNVITIPEATYELLRASLWDAYFNGRDKQRAKKLLEILTKAEGEGKGEWY